MLNIRQFFSKIQGAHAQELVFRMAIQKSIQKQVNIEVPLGDISIKNSIVSINNSNSALKNTIFIKKMAIIKEINETQAPRTVIDIR